MTTASVSLRVLLASVTLTVASAMAVANDDEQDNSRHGNRPDQFYTNKRLVSDGAFPANFTDPHLKNAWGVAFNPQGFVWVADADGHVSTLYDGNGQPSPPPPSPQQLVVSVPGPDGTPRPLGKQSASSIGTLSQAWRRESHGSCDPPQAAA